MKSLLPGWTQSARTGLYLFLAMWLGFIISIPMIAMGWEYNNIYLAGIGVLLFFASSGIVTVTFR